MTDTREYQPMEPSVVRLAAERAARFLPPVWPLASSVAVNPFLGQIGDRLAQVAARLERVSGARVTMTRAWYRERFAQGLMTDADLLASLQAAPASSRPRDLDELKKALQVDRPKVRAVENISDLASQVSGIDWPGIIAERFGSWAAGFFDEGQALWAAPHDKRAYVAWRSVATHDLTPEIRGLSGFATFVSLAPETAAEALLFITSQLELRSEALETYFHQMLMTLGGWSQYARYKLWQAELEGRSDPTIIDFLTIRMVWEAALLARYKGAIADRWKKAQADHAAPLVASLDQEIDVIFQETFERAAQRSLGQTLASPPLMARTGRPPLQAAFCIDVRSEVFRRALEAVSPSTQTLGFAGFFGLPVAHHRFASDVRELRLPVLLNPSLTSHSGDGFEAADDQAARFKARASRAWGRFKLAAVSSFAFVEATGPLYVYKLLRSSLALDAPKAVAEPVPHLDPAPDLLARTKAAETVLKAMSLIDNFAPLVLLIGHGAAAVNNAHLSGLHCGACGGYPGDVNARLLASLLNDPLVRVELLSRSIEIPSDTLFLGALHNTTTDAVTIYADDARSTQTGLKEVKGWMDAAGKIARDERALRLPNSGGEKAMERRSHDWSQIRPEWGLAGCKAFIVAPRDRTLGKDLQGRCFLHDYNWAQDKGFEVLELIMTAPVVVASWISLQYYGSTVTPQLFGGGNKLLHNVAGGVGVMEGNGGLLRPGLPWQSVHDGERYIHEPLRLSVCIEAPLEAMNEILRRHDGLRALFENRWLHLFALDDQGRLAQRYAGQMNWIPLLLGEFA